MKAKYILTIAIMAVGLTACTDYFDKHMLDNGDVPVLDIRTGMTYVLTDNDYKLISNYLENIEKALALDPVDSTAYKELKAIATEKAFTETASADMYVPAFMDATFPYLDNGTTCDLTYTMREGKSDRVQEFASAQGFTMTVDDYELLWQKRGANYVTPSTYPKLPDFLAAKLTTATVGKIALISYTFTEEEP
ncbi:MAG: hypothetical protein IKM83_00705, partial [Paludibacteraceae bacterium]|nr:hypothetical protein [Paludibacteraceae bacterium]